MAIRRRVLVVLAFVATVGACGDDTSASTSSASTSAASTAAALGAIAWPANVKVTVDAAAGTWTITTNGRPSHALPAKYLLPKPGVDARTVTLDKLQIGATPNQTVNATWTLPLVPKKALAVKLFGPIGIAWSGGWINDPYEGDQKTIALESNFTIDGVDFLDTCSGHFNPMGYHYHGIPYCMTKAIDTAGQHSKIVGFAADGFPIYGPQGSDGNEVKDLDECRGHAGPTPEFPGGIYHYHLTSTFPYTTLCLAGVVDRAATVHAGH